MTSPRVRIIYVEPTPYVEGLIAELKLAWPGPIAVSYLTRNSSQNWGLDGAGEATLYQPGLKGGLAGMRRDLARLSRGDIVHLAGWGHPVLMAAIVLARLRGLKVLVESDTAQGRGVSGWRAWMKRLLYPALFTLVDHFLPGGLRQAAYLRSFGVPDRKISIAQMTVDVAAIQAYAATGGDPTFRQRHGVPASATVAAYVGRLEDYKGILDALRAFSLATEQCGDLRLVIVGDGGLGPRVRDAAVADARISWLGRQSGQEVLNAYLASDMVLVPSHFEPWGLVVNEAMACGRAVIASDRVGCLDDLVDDGVTGLVVPAEDAEALAGAMKRLASDLDLRRRLGENAAGKIAPWTLANEAERVTEAWRVK